MNDLIKDSEARLLTEEVPLDKEVAELLQQMAQNAEHVENSIAVIKNTGTRITDMKELRHRQFLTGLYAQQKYKQDFAMASLMKGLIVQNAMFFGFSKETLPEAVKKDQDNTNKGKSFDMKPFCKLLAKNGIVQLWDAVVSTKKEERKVAGYLVYNPAIRNLLKVDNQEALKQFRELKKLAGNDWVTEDMVFDSCGGLSIKPEVHRVLVEARRTKGPEPRTEGKALGCKGPINTVAMKKTSRSSVSSKSSNVDNLKHQLANFFDNEKLDLLKGWHNDLVYEGYVVEIKNHMETSFLELMSENCEVSRSEFETAMERAISSKVDINQIEDTVKAFLDICIEHSILEN